MDSIQTNINRNKGNKIIERFELVGTNCSGTAIILLPEHKSSTKLDDVILTTR